MPLLLCRAALALSIAIGAASATAAEEAGAKATETGYSIGADGALTEQAIDVADEDYGTLHALHTLFLGGSFPRWSVTTGTTILHRSAPRSTPLVEDLATAAPLLSAADLNLGFAAGPRLEIVRHFDTGYEFQFLFFGVDRWNTKEQLVAEADTLSVPFLPASSFGGLATSYGSSLFSEEFNARSPIFSRLTLVWGFRFLQLNETFALSGTTTAPGGSGAFAVKTHNRLLGWQFGAELPLWDRGNRLVASTFIKAGIYGNAASQSSSAAGGPDFIGLSSSESTFHEAFVGEVGVNATYKFSDHWAAFAGYQGLWIDRIALAPNQVFSAPIGLSVSGSPFFHGTQLGLQLLY